MKSKKNLLLVVIMLSLIFSCTITSVDDLALKEVNGFTFNKSKTVRYNGSFLEFLSFEDFRLARNYNFISRSKESFEPTKTGFALKHPKEISEEMGLNSLGHLFAQLKESQTNHLSKILKEHGSLAELKLKVGEEAIFSESVLRSQHILNLDKTTGEIALKLFNHELAYLLNEDGVVAVAGIIYQYTETKIKSCRLTEDFDILSFLQSDSAVDPNINVSNIDRVESKETTDERVVACTGYFHGNLFVTGKIEQIDFTEQVNNCYSDPACFETGQFICCYEPTIVYGSNFYVQTNSYTSCGGVVIPFIGCTGGVELYQINELGHSGNYSFTTITGISGSSSFQKISYNTSEVKQTLYIGDRISSASASGTFTGAHSLNGFNSSGTCSRSF